MNERQLQLANQIIAQCREPLEEALCYLEMEGAADVHWRLSDSVDDLHRRRLDYTISIPLRYKAFAPRQGRKEGMVTVYDDANRQYYSPLNYISNVVLIFLFGLSAIMAGLYVFGLIKPFLEHFN